MALAMELVRIIYILFSNSDDIPTNVHYRSLLREVYVSEEIPFSCDRYVPR
jgi:hypothetical protein